MSDREDEYLVDGTGEPDADVTRLERVLRPLGRREGAPLVLPKRDTRLYVGLGLAAAAAAALIVVVRSQSNEPAPKDSGVVAVSLSTPTGIRDALRNEDLAVGAWVESGDTAREILLGEMGRVRVAAMSRLQVRDVTSDTTRLYLARGAIEATVTADARPGFFQVDTDAARCVDLGCRYTLEVDDAGVAKVHVVTGRVAFETGDREVFVPAGASCTANKDLGPATPHFDDARADLVAAFDAYDAAATATVKLRRSLALAALDTVRDGRDTLPAWHLLQDKDAEVATAAARRLELVAGRCDGSDAPPGATLREAWKAHLAARCW